MHTVYHFTAGDTGSKIRVGFVNAATGRKLTPFNGVYNASLWVKPFGGSPVKRVMTVLSGEEDSFAEYQFLSTELAEGVLEVQGEATLIADDTVVSQLGTSTYLVGPKL